MLTVFSLNDANSSRNVTQTPSRSSAEILCHDFLAQIDRVLERRRREDLVHDDEAVRRRLIEYLVDPNQIVLQLAAEIRDVLFPFEVREEAVKEKEPSFRARNRAAQAGQIMQLAEHARERRLAALVRAGNDEDALRGRSERNRCRRRQPFRR